MALLEEWIFPVDVELNALVVPQWNVANAYDLMLLGTLVFRQ